MKAVIIRYTGDRTFIDVQLSRRNIEDLLDMLNRKSPKPGLTKRVSLDTILSVVPEEDNQHYDTPRTR